MSIGDNFDPLHTLGYLAADWIEAHCKVPGGVFEGDQLAFDGYQLICTVNHYRVKPNAKVDPRRLVAPFTYRRSQIVGPQKCGKSPMGAGITLFEAVGPALFDGFAADGDTYRCSDHGCSCGFEYEYLPGEAKGIPRNKSLVGLLASAEDQVANIYEPLQTMIQTGPLDDVVKVREGFIRLPNRGRITPLTSASKSKLGRPFTFVIADETGLYTGKMRSTWETLRRNVAGMQGRSIEFTNPWDPMENSSAQRTFEARAKDIYRYYRRPPVDIPYSTKAGRRKVHAFVYADAPWVDIHAVSAEADELAEVDPTQAERFFGNRLVQGLGSYMPEELWDATEAEVEVPDGTPITLGFDGSRSGDWSAIRAETLGGHRFTPTYGPDERPTFWNPDEWNGRIPRSEVTAAVSELFGRYKVARFYVDPRHWETQADAWALEHGEDVVVTWPTNQIGRMFEALTRMIEDTREEITTHDGDETAKRHALAARKVAKPGDKYILGKPAEHMKIDILMADILAHEAASDMRALGWEAKKDRRMIVLR